MKNTKFNSDYNQNFNLQNKSEGIEQLKQDIKEIQDKFNEAELIARFGFFELDTNTLSQNGLMGFLRFRL
jgi:hypothetical protein